jgi:hypothetical protein
MNLIVLRVYDERFRNVLQMIYRSILKEGNINMERIHFFLKLDKRPTQWPVTVLFTILTRK